MPPIPFRPTVTLLGLVLATACAVGQFPGGPAVDNEGLAIDAERREVRVPGEALRVDMPLEFVCVVSGTADHEALLRTRVAPSAIHAALLGIGMEPGRPLRYSEAAGRWLAPEGPPVRIEIEWQGDDGQTIRERVGRLIRHVETGEPMPVRNFVFVGSQIMRARDGQGYYAADGTGQVVSLVNFEFPVIDVGEIKSSANETLEWETDPDTAPPHGTPVTMILSPIGDAIPPGDSATPATRPSDDAPADGRIEALRRRWEETVLPRQEQLRDAAEAHYALMEAYQAEINRLIEEADRLRREKEQLQARFNDLTTPRPAGE